MRKIYVTFVLIKKRNYIKIKVYFQDYLIGEKVFRYNLDSIDQLKLKDDKKINDQFSNRKSTDSIQINNSIEKNIKSILNINKNPQ